MEKMLDPWYVTGFCEGEATFTYNTSGSNISLCFAIKLASGEAGIIYNIYDFFKVGHIYRVKPLSPVPNKGPTKSAIYYRVSKILDLEIVVDHFEKYPLQGDKRKRYNIWKEMFSLKKQYRKYDKEKLLSLSKKLSSLSPRNLAWE